MSDEIVVAPIEGAAPAPAPEVDPYEARAIELGWKKDYDGEDKVDAKEFVTRAPLFERIKSQGRKLKDQEKALHDLTQHIKTVETAAYKRAIADLQLQKREAVEQADPDRVAAIDKEIDQVREHAATVKTESGVHPAVGEWLGKQENQWFNSDSKLRNFAISYQNTLFAENPALDMEESLKEVSKAVKRAFPDKFTNPARTAPAAVESPAAAVAGKKVYTFRDLNDEQRSIANRFDRMGVMSKDDYVKQLAENGLIGG